VSPGAIFDQRLDLPTRFSSNVITQPSSQRLRIGYCGLAESESRSNLGAKAFVVLSARSNPPSAGTVTSICRAKAADIQRLQIGWHAWEPTAIAEKHQPRCKRESVRSAL